MSYKYKYLESNGDRRKYTTSTNYCRFVLSCVVLCCLVVRVLVAGGFDFWLVFYFRLSVSRQWAFIPYYFYRYFELYFVSLTDGDLGTRQ